MTEFPKLPTPTPELENEWKNIAMNLPADVKAAMREACRDLFYAGAAATVRLLASLPKEQFGTGVVHAVYVESLRMKLRQNIQTAINKGFLSNFIK